MAAHWILVKALLRDVTEDASYRPISDISLAYAKLREIQRGHFDVIRTNDGLTQVSSTIGETAFTFAVPDGLERSAIIEMCETALELIEGKTIPQVRALLRRRKTTRPDFTRLSQ